ncbi:hypothetical protein HRbin36_01319 [bacterium HR36]|nr:hypothetical protein HRbin36_01319 [bacterium HR36]
MILRAHFACRVHFRPGYVGVHIHTTRHDDKAGGIHNAVGFEMRIGGRRDDFSILDPQVADFPVHAISRVVHLALGNT